MARPILAILASAAMWAVGCSTLSGYPAASAPGRRAFESMDFERAAMQYGRKTGKGLDRLCYLFEQGTALHAGGQFDESNAAFLEAQAMVREFDSRAVVSARDAAASAAALLLNDKAQPYRGEAFERMYAHSFAAMNFLMMGERPEARVQARQAWNRQRYERLRMQDEYDRAVRLARERGAFSEEALDKARAAYGDAPEVELFQDAFVHYLSSVIYEIGGDYQNALVEMRNLLRFQGRSRAGQEQLARIEAKAFPVRASEEALALLPGEGEGEVIVLFLCGLAPEKREEKVTLPLPTGAGWALATVAFPKYRRRPNPVAYAGASVGGRDLGASEVLSDVEAKAEATLAKRLPATVLRSLLRAASRVAGQAALQHAAASRTGGEAGQTGAQAALRAAALLVGVASMAVEQADLRSWLTLPRSFQVVRGLAPEGAQTLQVRLLGPGGSPLAMHEQAIEVAAGRYTVVVVRSIGTRAVSHARTL